MSRRNPALKKDAARLKRDFNRDFWMPHEKFIAQALDGAKRPVEAITSNPGHCLWMRILDGPTAAHVTSRLMSRDLFSGWGIRTLSDRAGFYEPGRCHNGSVQPVDTAGALAGMRQYGLAADVERTARVLAQASDA